MASPMDSAGSSATIEVVASWNMAATRGPTCFSCRTTVIVLTNLDNGSGNMPGIIARSIAGVIDPGYLPPHLMSSSRDPAPGTTDSFLHFLNDFGEEKAMAMMTPEQDRYFHEQPDEVRMGMTDLFRTIQSVVFLGEDDVRGRAIARFGVPVVRIRYYKAEGPGSSRYFSCWMTKGGRIADMRSYPY